MDQFTITFQRALPDAELTLVSHVTGPQTTCSRDGLGRTVPSVNRGRGNTRSTRIRAVSIVHPPDTATPISTCRGVGGAVVAVRLFFFISGSSWPRRSASVAAISLPQSQLFIIFYTMAAATSHLLTCRRRRGGAGRRLV